MESKTDITLREETLEMEPSADAPALPPLSEHAEKGSLRSMWELLMQLRVLLPYLTRLVPLLDRGLLKAAPDLTDIRKGLDEIRTGSHGLNTQIKSHSLQLERMEEQILRLREAGDQSRREVSDLSVAIRSLRWGVRGLAGLLAVVLALLIAVLVLQILHFGP